MADADVMTLEEFDYLTGGLSWDLKEVRAFLKKKHQKEKKQ